MMRFDEFLPGGLVIPNRHPLLAIGVKRRRFASERYSANLIVDIGGTAQSYPSIVMLSGIAFPCSGALIGQGVDMINSDTFCNLNVVGVPVNASGQLRIAVQTSDSDTSGTYTDPTSGLAQLPTSFESGGILRLNSGGIFNGTFGSGTSGAFMQSGFSVYAAFQRPQAGRFVRANALSGDFYAGALAASFVANLKTTGSGGGYTLSPTSGPVNV